MITSCLTRSLRSLLVEGNSVTISALACSFFLLRCCCASSHFYSCCASSRFHSCFPSMPGRYRQRFHSGESIQIISLSPVINMGAETKRSENFQFSDFLFTISFQITEGHHHCTDSNEEIFSNLYPIYLFNFPSRLNSPYNAKGISTGVLHNFSVVESIEATNSGTQTQSHINIYIYSHIKTHDDHNKLGRILNSVNWMTTLIIQAMYQFESGFDAPASGFGIAGSNSARILKYQQYLFHELDSVRIRFYVSS